MLAWLCMIAGALLPACSAASAAADDDPAAAQEAPPAVVRTITLEPAKLSQHRDGIALILTPGDLVDLDAELRNAKIAIDFSTLQFDRYKSTPTLPRLTVENAERQLKTDQSQIDRLKARLAHTWGENAPMIDEARRKDIVAALAAGTKALARIDFPGTLDSEPQNVVVKALGGQTPVKVETLWQAPSGNQAMPGVSYFALLPQSAGLRPGDRATATAETLTLAGLVIPNESLVVTESTSWCYVEKEPGEYERKPVSLSTPTGSGYLVKDGFEAGMKIVVSGASTLLAREADPAAGGDDDDDGPARPAPKPKAKPAPETHPEAAAKEPSPKDGDDDDKAPPPKPAQASAEADGDGDADASKASGATGASPVDRN